MRQLFRGSMRHGAAILFLFAVAQFLMGLIPLVYEIITETERMAENYSYVAETPGMRLSVQLQVLLGSVSNAAFPFFGALVIDRLDRWLTPKAPEAAE